MIALSTMLSRAEEERLHRTLLDLPKEVRETVLKEMNEHAPEMREIMKQTRPGAVPVELRVRDGDGWREVMSPEIAEQHGRKTGGHGGA